jgi:hypothetical protein
VVAPAISESQWADASYVRWLEERSMLFQAGEQARLVSGKGIMAPRENPWRPIYFEITRG